MFNLKTESSTIQPYTQPCTNNDLLNKRKGISKENTPDIIKDKLDCSKTYFKRLSDWVIKISNEIFNFLCYPCIKNKSNKPPCCTIEVRLSEKNSTFDTHKNINNKTLIPHISKIPPSKIIVSAEINNDVNSIHDNDNVKLMNKETKGNTPFQSKIPIYVASPTSLENKKENRVKIESQLQIKREKEKESKQKKSIRTPDNKESPSSTANKSTKIPNPDYDIPHAIKRTVSDENFMSQRFKTKKLSSQLKQHSCGEKTCNKVKCSFSSTSTIGCPFKLTK